MSDDGLTVTMTKNEYYNLLTDHKDMTELLNEVYILFKKEAWTKAQHELMSRISLYNGGVGR